ncbi:MAG: cytochrome c oxidase subunit II [Candidatus Eremiobacteraeota bacterium]|nr:cytochrome c oxidase subunit II [Candidatus Eremiobacteraeota bacterium]
MHFHRYERIWMAFGLSMLVVFLIAITVAAIAEGFVPPSHVQSIDPTKVAKTPPFDKPGLRKRADGSYEAYYVARIFSFTPSSITIPAGSRVDFYVTSADVEHGFQVPETGVNTMVTPGWVSEVSHTFRRPGTFLLLCNEYCGAGHQTMAAKIVVQ